MVNAQEEQYLAKLVAQAKAKCKEQYGVAIEKAMAIDVGKTLEENKQAVLQAIKDERDAKLKDRKADKGKADKQAESEKAKKEAEELRRLKEEEEKAIGEWKKQFNPEMIIKSPAYFEMEKYVEMVCGGLSNFCVVSSQGGLAKTWTTQAILKKKLGENYAYLNSFTSPLELYNFLYDNSGKVILIDDCEGIWDNKPIVSLLKNATEMSGRRAISWNSTTSRLEGRSSTRLFDGRIILLTNKLPNPEDNPHIEALLNRAFLCRLEFSYREKIDILKEVSRREYQSLSAEERREIYEFIERNTSEATKDLSIRTLIKCYHFYLYDKKIWKELGRRILQADARKEVVLELMKSGKPVKEQESIYHAKTGHSRADFYRIRQDLRPKVADYPRVAAVA